jgi:hypothetical protein
MKDKRWLYKIPYNELNTPIGMFRGSPVTPIDIVKYNIPENKIEPLDNRIAREIAFNTLNKIINNSKGIMTGSGSLLNTNNIPENILDAMALTLKKRAMRHLQK